MKGGNDEIAALSSRIRIEGLKLIIFTNIWGKCVKSVGKYLLETLTNKGS